MNKKLLVSVLLCFFVFSLGALTKEKAKASIIEHLVWAATPLLEFAFRLEITDYFKETTFESDPLLTFHVPASQKSDALFFELWTETSCRLSELETRKLGYDYYVKIISDVIPSNMNIYSAGTIVHMHETNNSYNYDLQYRREGRRYTKLIMRRDRRDYWLATENGQWVPDVVVIPILNDLINSGFDIELRIYGFAQGIKNVNLRLVKMEVTRLSKN